MKRPQITKTQQEDLSKIDWDSEMEAASLDDSPNFAQEEQDNALAKALGEPPLSPQTSPGPWTEQELRQAGIPESHWPVANLWDDLQVMKEHIAK